jgi:ring-1,2-phenylacetyl-CoA epoxidase subunit PaaB
MARKAPLDQFGTFEVFVRPKDGKPYQHEGSLHAPNLEMAFVLAKETFTRRFTCVSICVVDTRQVMVTPTTEGDQSVFSLLSDSIEPVGPERSYEVYALMKRGKQHIHLATVKANGPMAAIRQTREIAGPKTVYNLWAIQSDDFRFTDENELDFWLTLPEKKFRDAADYKGGDKLKDFLERTKN